MTKDEHERNCDVAEDVYRELAAAGPVERRVLEVLIVERLGPGQLTPNE
jgi:hypothetical protein